MSLPRGATAVDFAYAVHTDIGNHCVAAKVNGELVALRTELRNGDRVEIITAGYAKPNPAWLQYVRTGKARSNIRHFLKTMQYDESAALGERLLEQALKAAGHSPAEIDDAELGARGARLRARIRARKCWPTSAWASACRRWWRGSCCARPSARRRRAASRRARGRASSIRGTEGMAVQLASCCRPIPGDAIVGSMKKGQGLVVHTAECRQALRSRTHRARAVDRRRMGPRSPAACSRPRCG